MERTWYYRKEGGNHEFVRGPFTLEELRRKRTAGLIDNGTSVRCGDGPWVPLAECLPDVPVKRKSRGRAAGIIVVGALMILGLIGVVSRWGESEGEPWILGTADGQMMKPAMTPRQPRREALNRLEVIRLTNEVRASQGLTPLQENRLLNTIAEERMRDMFARQYMDHISPTGEGAGDVAQKVGYSYRRLGENLANGGFVNNQKLVNGWVQSPGHRRNILTPEFNEIGVAVGRGRLDGSDTWIGVQIFGSQSPPLEPSRESTIESKFIRCAPPSDTLRISIDQERHWLKGMEEDLTRLGEEIDRERRRLGETRGAVRQSAVAGVNDVVEQHNRLAKELTTRKSALQELIREYNRGVADYNTCAASSR